MKNNKHSKTKKNLDGIVKSEEIIGSKEELKPVPQTLENVGKKEITTAKAVLSKNEKVQKKTKNKGFIGSSLAELRLVKWPTFKYVVGWSLTIILFTGLIGSVMGFTDYYFESGVQFIDCTSPNGSKNKSTDDCLKDLTSNLTFQKYFNSEAASTAAQNNNTDQTAPTQTPQTDSIPIENIEPEITADGTNPQTIITPSTDQAPSPSN